MGLKEEFLELLERDKEFRYAVAGKLGLEEILRRLDRHEEHLTKLREDMVGFRRHYEILAKLEAQLVKLRSMRMGCNVRLNGLKTRPRISSVTTPSRAWSSSSPSTTGVWPSPCGSMM